MKLIIFFSTLFLVFMASVAISKKAEAFDLPKISSLNEHKNMLIPNKHNIIDDRAMTLIDQSNADDSAKYTVAGMTKAERFNYNMGMVSEPIILERAYLSNPILLKSNKKMLNYLVPEDYSLADIRNRDNSPITRLSAKTNSDIDSPDITIRASNALLDFIFSSATGDILGVNIVPSDTKEGLSIFLRPIKGLILKYSKAKEMKKDLSSFEVKILPNNYTNLILKTKESEGNMTTGIEFQMLF